MSKMFYTSRLFRSIRRMPTPDDVAWRRVPLADTWNAREGRAGQALVYYGYDRGEMYTYFNIWKDCGAVTHWRWAAEGELDYVR